MKRYLLVIAALLLTSCASRDKYVQWEDVPPSSFPKLTAIGYAPLATQPAKEQSQRMLMAMQASKIVAYRELAEQVYGQKITANSSVSDWMLTDDNVKASVTGVIRGARVPAGEHYVTELELDFSKVWQIYQQQSRPQRIKEVTYF
ncbi:flagellar biosynthesis protein FlgP [Shewanella sp. LC2]|uniref:LPP20 family lipoprotein n=1 Tax=Shewanella sp. LC2 TaxID=2589789 RepID=UPI00112E54B1|nr:LPP20 family lipoprotein [Shewanella sp. LC2]TPE56427.1 flagellar biosynthesis protein FlgP [Shewanella sp. LC2]